METASELLARNPHARYIETSKGRAFYLDAPEFDIEEIAHSLSNLCRYNGHCKRFYSVAEHSVLVADIMEVLDLGNPMEGLLHDGSESILADIASPWKALLPDYQRIEAGLDLALRVQYGMPATKTEGCKRADWVALIAEAEQLIPSRAATWLTPSGIREDVVKAKGLLWLGHLGEKPDFAESQFLRRYERLGGRL